MLEKETEKINELLKQVEILIEKEKSIIIDCPECEGKGWTDNGHYGKQPDCQRCNSYGKLRVPVDNIRFFNADSLKCEQYHEPSIDDFV